MVTLHECPWGRTPWHHGICGCMKTMPPVSREADALQRLEDSLASWQRVLEAGEQQGAAAGAAGAAGDGLRTRRFLLLGQRIMRLNACLWCVPRWPHLHPPVLCGILAGTSGVVEVRWLNACDDLAAPLVSGQSWRALRPCTAGMPSRAS